MAKDKISDYSSTANSNTDIAGINIDEGCAPSGINDAIRTLMAQLKTWQSGGQDVYIHPAGTASAPSITANGDTNTGIFFPAADTVAVTTGGTERVRVDSSGNLGIGTSSLDANWSPKLQVSSSATDGSGGIVIESYKPNLILKDSSASAQRRHIFADGGNQYFGYGDSVITTHMTLDASGRLGIGRTSPSYMLDIENATQADMRLLATGNVDFLISSIASGLEARFTKTGGSGPITFYNGGSERARIDSSGNLLVGTTSTIGSGTARVSVEGTGGVIFGIKSSGGVGNECTFNWNNATSGNNLFSSFYTEATATGRGSIDYNRGAGLVRYNTTSDATLKNIIGDADGTKSVDILKSTRIREYSWKEDQANKPQIGVIAQELHETFSGAVSVGGNKVEVDEEGNETTRYIPWAVDKTAFTFHLVAGWQAHEKIIQEQQAMIASQSAIITQLQADVAALKGNA